MTFLPGDLLFFKDDTTATSAASETEGSIIWSGAFAVVLEKCKSPNDILILCNTQLLLVPFVNLRRFCKKL